MTRLELWDVLDQVREDRIGTIVIVGFILETSLLASSLLSKGLKVEELQHLLVTNHSEAVEKASLLRANLLISTIKLL